MKTGADEDRRNTPIRAFSASSPLAMAPLATIKTQASAIRANPLIRFLRPIPSETIGHGLVAPDEGALPSERLLQPLYSNLARSRIARKCRGCGQTGGFAHGKAAAGDAGRRLSLLGHRRAAPGDQEVVDLFRHQHAIGQLIIAAR